MGIDLQDLERRLAAGIAERQSENLEYLLRRLGEEIAAVRETEEALEHLGALAEVRADFVQVGAFTVPGDPRDRPPKRAGNVRCFTFDQSGYGANDYGANDYAFLAPGQAELSPAIMSAMLSGAEGLERGARYRFVLACQRVVEEVKS